MEELTPEQSTLLIVSAIGAIVFFILVAVAIVLFFKRLEKQDRKDLEKRDLPPDDSL